jgi:hypothetical protein
MKDSLLIPMVGYIYYIGALCVLNFFTRFKAVKSGEVPFKYYKALLPTEGIPEVVINRGRHFDNQFQAPMVFFVICILFIVLNKTSDAAVVFAWLFVVSRFFHTYFHLGANNVRRRAAAFLTGWIFLLIMTSLLWI